METLRRKFCVIIVTLCCLVLAAAPSVTANYHAAGHHHHRHHQWSARKIVSVAAPIGPGVALGPAGLYQGFKHRRAHQTSLS